MEHINLTLLLTALPFMLFFIMIGAIIVYGVWTERRTRQRIKEQDKMMAGLYRSKQCEEKMNNKERHYNNLSNDIERYEDELQQYKVLLKESKYKGESSILVIYPYGSPFSEEFLDYGEGRKFLDKCNKEFKVLIAPHVESKIKMLTDDLKRIKEHQKAFEINDKP